MSKTKKNKVELEVVNVQRLSYFENDLNTLGLKKKEVKEGQLILDTEVEVFGKSEEVIVTMEVYFFVIKNKKELRLFGTTINQTFYFPDMGKYFGKGRSNKINIPYETMLEMLNSTFSCMRGILVVSENKSEYNNIILPVMEMEETAKELRSIDMTKVKKRLPKKK